MAFISVGHVAVFCRSSRAPLRSERDMGLMNAIGLQPRPPTPVVTSQGTQTPIPQLQNAETQTDRDPQVPSTFRASEDTDSRSTYIYTHVSLPQSLQHLPCLLDLQ